MRNPHPTDRLLTALAHCGSVNASALLCRLSQCGGEGWNGQFTCRTPACARCRGRYIGSQCRAALKRFTALGNDRLAFASIVIGATTHLDDIADLFAKFRKDLRNLVEANRRQRRRWNGLEALLWLETDALCGEDYCHLGTDKQAQLGEMAPMFVQASGPVWVITVHGVIAHPDIDHQEVQAELDRRWPGTKRVDVRPFYGHQTEEQNLRYTINYALKHQCRTHLGNIIEPWPASWIAAYYSHLHQWSRGFQSMRISIGRSSKILTTQSVKNYTNVIDDNDREPLPFIYSNSIFDTHYN